MTKTTWKQRIEEAKKRGRFTEIDKMYAEEWRWCMVGETFDINHESDVSKLPLKVRRLGRDFSIRVDANMINAVQVIYNKILKAKEEMKNA